MYMYSFICTQRTVHNEIHVHFSVFFFFKYIRDAEIKIAIKFFKSHKKCQNTDYYAFVYIEKDT